jgi:outer membrane murein-binding lipoprotein Lpp
MSDDKLSRVGFDELEVGAQEIEQRAREAERELAWNELRRVMRRVNEVEKGFEELQIKVSQLEHARDAQRLEIQMAVAAGEINARMGARLELHIEAHATTIAEHTEAISRFSPLKSELEALYVVCAKLSGDQRQLAEEVGDRD